MNAANNILVFGGGAAAELLADRLSRAAAVVHVREPYEALERMARRDWSAIVLATGQKDLPAMCRAVRRLRRGARVYAVCTVAFEPSVRLLLGELIDDYFLDPLSRSDLARILQTVQPVRAETAPANGALTPRQFALLAESTGSQESLETAVAGLVSRRLGLVAKWDDLAHRPDKVPAPLLSVAGQSRRGLFTETPADKIDGGAAALLADLRQCLPALMTTARRTESLRHLAVTDYLTGTYNRRYFYQMTDRLLRKASQNNTAATLLLYDIDNFKHYNDTYGYAAGDEVLRETASLIQRTSRSHDVVARIGGDEFAVLFWDSDQPRQPDSRPPESAFTLADRFRRAVLEHHFASLGHEAKGVLTISGGLASFPRDGKSCRELLRRADEAIKVAKKTGKNVIRAG